MEIKSELQIALEFLSKKPGYLKKSPLTLALAINSNNPNLDLAKQALQLAKSLQRNPDVPIARYCPKPYLTGDKDNILVIGDLHEPFCLDEYLEFNRILQEKFECGTVIFAGDIIDNHYASYHEVEQSALGADDEFSHAKARIQEWYSTFPKATVLVGNHDRLIMRKAKSSGISKYWLKNFNEALDTQGWDFVDSIIIDNVYFSHGESGTASTRVRNSIYSHVQGHLHSEGYVQYSAGSNKFAMQVGCGIDNTTYAMAYAKDSKEPFIGSGVIYQGTPILVPMRR